MSSILDIVVLGLLVSEGANQEMTGEMKSHRIQKAPKGISFILHGAHTRARAGAGRNSEKQLPDDY